MVCAIANFGYSGPRVYILTHVDSLLHSYKKVISHTLLYLQPE